MLNMMSDGVNSKISDKPISESGMRKEENKSKVTLGQQVKATAIMAGEYSQTEQDKPFQPPLQLERVELHVGPSKNDTDKSLDSIHVTLGALSNTVK